MAMEFAALHDRLPLIVPGVLSPVRRDGGAPHTPGPAGTGELAAVEAHAAGGCSRCARALVNAAEVCVTLAEVGREGMPSSPASEAGKLRTAVRERVLADVRSRRAAAPPIPRGQQRRFFDPAGEVARRHIGAPGDAERTREVDALAFGTASDVDSSRRLLAQVQRLLAFPLAFVSVVRGERVGYHAQIGMPESAGRSRRRETTFCTHTVSVEAPLIVPNAAVEPFFRSSSMVQREGVKAYVGVPLRTSRGVVIGTLCVMDFVPRFIGAAHVRVLDLFTEPVAAAIERPRGADGDRAWPRTSAGAPLHPEGWFDRLLRAVSTAIAPGREPALVVASGAGAEGLGDLAGDHEPVGRLGGAVGLLLVDEPGANAERFAALRAAGVEHLPAGVSLDLVAVAGAITNYFP